MLWTAAWVAESAAVNNAVEAADSSGKLRRRRAENVWTELTSDACVDAVIEPGDLLIAHRVEDEAEDVTGAPAENSGMRRQLCRDPSRDASHMAQRYSSAVVSKRGSATSLNANQDEVRVS